MKKIYYLVCACVFSTVFHLNAQTTCADAIPFDWSANNTQEAETTVWYKVSLTPLKNEEGMDLKLYINNASATETAQNLRLTTLPSAVRVTSLAEQTIKIYSLTGTCLFHNNMHADETVSLSLPEGIYIVQSDTETHKIIVF